MTVTDRRQTFEDILRHGRITTLFQPIFDIRRQTVFAYEALSRGPEGSEFHLPDPMFAAARQHARLAQLDQLCQERAVDNFSSLALPGKLAINIDPHSLIDTGHAERTLLRFVEACGLENDRIILELTEHSRIDCFEELKRAARYYRDMGFDIAMDDLSAGYSHLRLLSDLEPEYVKLDKHFISRIDTDPVAEDFVRTLIALARRVKCRIIAEGIETPSQLQHICRLDVDYAQGFLLGAPDSAPAAAIPPALLDICPTARRQQQPATAPDELVASLDIHATPSCTPDIPAAEVLALFQADPLLRAVPVLDGGRAVGLLTREGIFGAFALAYGHSLHRRSHVEKMMHAQPLTAQVDDLLSDVSRRATARQHELIYAPIIVFDGDRYVGTAFIHDLLEKITEIQVNYALDANPLTGLPGNRRIDREVNRRLQGTNGFFLCHLDIDNFKAFNDRFGYERGDEMIMLVAELLRQGRGEADYIGHIGGDDFVLITSDAGWEPRLREVLDAFARDSRELYDEADRLAGCIRVKNRAGRMHEVPLASLSVGALPCIPGRFSSHLEAAAAVFELKCLAKNRPGNQIVIDRRKA